MPKSVLRRRLLGAVYGPYTGTCFAFTDETDIEHIVATSEAHDSGLCPADRATRSRFATDLRNLTLASPSVNLHRKSAKDAAEWQSDRNRCWFATRIIEVRRAYGLTIDRREADALQRIPVGCESTFMEPMLCHTTTAPDRGADTSPAAAEMRSRATTITVTAGLPARRRAATASRPFAAITPRTATCATAMATVSCASKCSV